MFHNFWIIFWILAILTFQNRILYMICIDRQREEDMGGKVSVCVCIERSIWEPEQQERGQWRKEICESVRLGKGMRSVWNKVKRVKGKDFKRHQENMVRNSREGKCSKWVVIEDSGLWETTERRGWFRHENAFCSKDAEAPQILKWERERYCSKGGKKSNADYCRSFLLTTSKCLKAYTKGLLIIYLSIRGHLIQWLFRPI